MLINIVSGDGAVPEQRNAQDVHATGPAPWPQHTRRRDHVQRDRVWPRGRSVPQPDQNRVAGHHRLPVVRFFGVSRTVHGRTATETGKSTNSDSTIRRFSSLKNYFHNIVWPVILIFPSLTPTIAINVSNECVPYYHLLPRHQSVRNEWKNKKNYRFQNKSKYKIKYRFVYNFKIPSDHSLTKRVQTNLRQYLSTEM